MPFYRATVPQGSLSRDQKRELALAITDVHCARTGGTPRKFVHVVFTEFSTDDGFSGGEPSTVSMIIGLIRAGRSEEVRIGLVTGITDRWREITGQSSADVLVALHEVRPRDAMEWGVLLPEDGAETAWIAEHDLALTPATGRA
ncbi:MAG TPA: tautomerase family protein [Sporichthyaceae bacterium]|jgi:phenylpyruvate tautomerase PptA (4-oxalocrotonate tautomerase family)|nr:tautomerase family protein [Sporichthyaceae bacterium]